MNYPGKTLITVLLTIIAVYPAVGATYEPQGHIELNSQSPIQLIRCGLQHHITRVLDHGDYTIGLRHNWNNYWLYEENVFRIDGELHELSIYSRFGVGQNLELSAYLPFRYVDGGVMDGFIEGFHRTLGIGQAGRDLFDRDQFAFDVYTGKGSDGWSRLHRDQTGLKIGNAIVSCSKRLRGADGTATVLTVGAKLPVGNRTEYFGGQSVDVGASLATGFQYRSWFAYLSGGLVYFGDVEMLDIELRQWHYSALVALEWHRPHWRQSYIAQLLIERGVAVDFHQFSDRTYELLLGFKHRLPKNLSLEFGLLENLFKFVNSPDVGLHFAIYYHGHR
ncbi:MAG TPA: DUF3187 family protein [candidate division Zixibacteria bacterium]|nr:DUF3187 family protein [candidate division Zixibacteria bacterium]